MSAVRKKRKAVSLKKTSAYSNYKKQSKKNKKQQNHKQTKQTVTGSQKKSTKKPTSQRKKSPKTKTKKPTGRPLQLSLDIGIDLGTSHTAVYVKNRGIVFNEPTVVALDKETQEVVAVGNAARSILKERPGTVEAIRPIKNGVIADYDVTEKMLQYFIEQAYGRNWVMKPRIIICMPLGATAMEQQSIKQAALQSGARQSFLMEKPMAAAMGIGINVHSASGNLIVDIGGGTTNISVIALDGIVSGKTILCGGEQINEAIIKHIRREHGLMIGEHCAEDIKCSIGTAVITDLNKKNSVQVKGKDIKTGETKTVNYNAKECNQAIMPILMTIINEINDIMEQISPELISDIIAKGLILTGGGSRLDNIALFISQKTFLHVSTAEDPELSVAKGTGKALEMLGRISSTGYFTRRI
jgi:rod shape-determining protein MreB